jgi:hypothetical protein
MTHMTKWGPLTAFAAAVACVLLIAAPVHAAPQSAQRPTAAVSSTPTENNTSAASASQATFPNASSAPAQAAQSANQQLPNQQSTDQQLPGSISGVVIDPTGSVMFGAKVTVSSGNHSAIQQAESDSNGEFSFVGVAPGPFEITISAPGFSTQTSSGTLRSGENYAMPQIELPLAMAVTQVTVEPTQVIAEREIRQQEKQRVLGAIPNFYVTYLPDAVPLTSKQKFELAWKTTIDPVGFALTGAVAGVEQAQNHFSGYGQGFGGYAKRYGASYGDLFSGTFIGSAILPSLLKQDPRYFYKGTGSARSRLLYAIANSVICKGDNGRWQANYSNILGSLAAGGISNLYYPANDRNGAALTFETALIGIGATAAANVLQEFLIKKLTPNTPNDDAPKSASAIGRVLSAAFAHEGA